MVIASYYVLGGALLGAALGAFVARRRGGRPVDMAHYGTVLAILFALIGLFLSVWLGRVVAG